MPEARKSASKQNAIAKRKPNRIPTSDGTRNAAAATGLSKWRLRLYVAGNTPNSIAAFGNLKEICESHLGGTYEIEVIDLLRQPQLAAGDQIIAVPTLVRRLPHPVKKIIGDLSNQERVLVGLELKPANYSGTRRR